MVVQESSQICFLFDKIAYQHSRSPAININILTRSRVP